LTLYTTQKHFEKGVQDKFFEGVRRNSQLIGQGDKTRFWCK